MNRPETIFPSWKRAGRPFLALCLEREIELMHTEPGKPVQNAHVESFHGKLRDECLYASWFANLFEARRKIAAWRKEYNEERPHSSLGYRTPAEFAAAYAAKGGSAGVPFAGENLATWEEKREEPPKSGVSAESGSISEAETVV